MLKGLGFAYWVGKLASQCAKKAGKQGVRLGSARGLSEGLSGPFHGLYPCSSGPDRIFCGWDGTSDYLRPQGRHTSHITRHMSRRTLDLTAKEIKFCRAYFQTNKQAECFVDAGLARHGQTSAAIHVAASSLVRRPKIRAFLARLARRALAASNISVDELAIGFASAINANVLDLFGPDGSMKPPDQWPISVSRHVQSREVREIYEGRGEARRAVGREWKIRLENKTECRRILATWRKMLSDQTEIEALKTEIDQLRRLVTVVDSTPLSGRVQEIGPGEGSEPPSEPPSEPVEPHET